MNRKTLALLVTMTLCTSFSAYATDNKDSKLEKAQANAVKIAHEAVAEKITQEKQDKKKMELNLSQVLALAVSNNRDVKIAQHNYEQAKIAVSSAAAAKNPTFTYDYSAGRTGNDAGRTDSFGNSVGVALPLYTGGASEGAIQAARYNREIAGASLVETEEATKLSAATAYYNLILARDNAEIADSSVENLRSHLRNVDAQYAVGIVAKSDVLSSRVALSQSQTTAISNKNTAEIAEANLNNLLNLPIDTALVVKEEEMAYKKYPIALQEAKEYALLHRVEIIQSSLAVKAAEEQVKVAKAGHRPTISLTAKKNWSDSEKWTGSADSNWSVGAGVSFNIWDGGATRSEIKSAKSQVEEAKEANDKQIDAVLLEVNEAYLDMKAAEQTIEATKVAVEEAEENFKIATVRYRAGVGTNLDVLDAELKLNQAKTSFIKSMYDYNISVITLEKAMGIIISDNAEKALAVVATKEN